MSGIVSSNPNDIHPQLSGEGNPVQNGAQPASDPLKDYFARKPRKEIGKEVMAKVSDYYKCLRESGLLKIYTRSYDAYYRGFARGGVLGKAGAENEMTTMHANHYRNILLHMRNNVTSQRPAFEPRAANTDYDSQAQTIVANGVLDFFNRDKNVDRNLDEATEYALYLSEGEIFLEWDATIGPDYTPDPNNKERTLKQGDLVIEALGPTEVIRDVHLAKASLRTWKIKRSWKNKYDLAAKYPDLAQKILALSPSNEELKDTRLGQPNMTESDQIPEYTLYHDKTPAVPQGLLVKVLSDDCVLSYGGLPYRQMPGYRIAGDEMHNTAFGYTMGWDILPVQEAVDNLYSTIITNQATFGVQNIAAPRGSGLTVTEIVGGLNLIEYDSKTGPPTALDLLKTPKEIFEFLIGLEHLMETLSGVNSVARGNPEASLKSGAALALVAAQAIQFSSGLQKSYAKLLEDVGTGIINILQDFATTPRIAEICGKSNRPLLSSFSNKDIASITRVTVDMGNPLSRTTAGKMEIANALLEKGMVKTPDEYLMVIQTGRLEPLIEGQTNELLLIRRENELLADGEEVPVVFTDNHVLHIQENKSVLSSPEARFKPEVVAAATRHLQAHIDALKTMDPIAAGLLGQPVLAQPSMPGEAGNPEADAEAAGLNAPENPNLAAGEAAKMPNMPTDPLTGQEYIPGGAQ